MSVLNKIQTKIEIIILSVKLLKAEHDYNRVYLLVERFKETAGDQTEASKMYFSHLATLSDEIVSLNNQINELSNKVS